MFCVVCNVNPRFVVGENVGSTKGRVGDFLNSFKFEMVTRKIEIRGC